MKKNTRYLLIGLMAVVLVIDMFLGVKTNKNVDEVKAEVGFEPNTIYVPTQDKVIVSFHRYHGQPRWISSVINELDPSAETKIIEEGSTVKIFNGYNSFELDRDTGKLLKTVVSDFSPELQNNWVGWTKDETSRVIKADGVTEYWTYGTGTEIIDYTEDMLDEAGEILPIKGYITVKTFDD